LYISTSLWDYITDSERRFKELKDYLYNLLLKWVIKEISFEPDNKFSKKIKLKDANEKGGAKEEYKVGFELSKKLFDDIKALHPKIHLMTANQFQIAHDILI